jgi:hypothetical protein
MKMRFRISIAFGGLLLAVSANASQLFVNGGFETNGGYGTTTFNSWSTGGTAASDDNFYADNGYTTPVNGNSTVGPFAGSWYAVSDNSGLVSPESSYIVQTVTIPLGTAAVSFSGEMFVNDLFGSSGLGAEIAVWAASVNVLTTAPLYVIQGFVDTGETTGSANPYLLYSQNITAHVTAGTTYQIGVLEEDAIGPINVGLDSFSLTATPGILTPEPATMLPTALLGAGILLYGLRRKVSAQV